MKRSVKEQRERAVKKIKQKRQTAADTTETVSAHYPDRLSEERLQSKEVRERSKAERTVL